MKGGRIRPERNAMEWMSRRRTGLTVGLAVAVTGLGAVCSFAPQDPTFTNLRYPKDGIANWLGYPGALAGGSLVEAFGWAAVLVPAAIAYWTLYRVGRPRGWRYAVQTAALLMLAAAWTGQWSPEPGLGLASAGLIGWSGANWVHSTVGRWPGFALLTAGLALSLWHQLYAPGMRSALKDLRAVGRLFTRAGLAQAQVWLRDRLEQAGTARRSVVATAVLAPVQVLGALLLGAGLALRRWGVAPLVSLAESVRGRAASLRNIKARTATRPLPLRRPAARSEQAASRDAEAFHGWLVDEPEPESRVADSQVVAAGTAAPPMASLDGFENLPWMHPADAPLHEADPLGPAAPAAPTGAQRLAELSPTAERLSRGADSTAERPRRALARGANSSVRGADSTAPETPNEKASGLLHDPIAPPPSARPELPPEKEGRERWERLLRRYRENLDLDWDEHSWRAKDDQGAHEDGAAKPRSPK